MEVLFACEISVAKGVTKDTSVKKSLQDIVRDLKPSRQLRLEDCFTYRKTRSIRYACSSKCVEWQNSPLLWRRKWVFALKGTFFAMLRLQRFLCFSLILVRSSYDTQYDKSLRNDIKEDSVAKQVRILDLCCLLKADTKSDKEKAKRREKHKEELEKKIYHILGKVHLTLQGHTGWQIKI